MECPICLEFIKSGSFIKFTPCMHHIHIKCINEWKVTSNNNSLIYQCVICNKYRDYEFTLNPTIEISDSISDNRESPYIRNEERSNWRDAFMRCLRQLLRI